MSSLPPPNTPQLEAATEQWYGDPGAKLSLTLTASWLVDDARAALMSIKELCRQAYSENPNNMLYGYRLEHVREGQHGAGAGQIHHNLTVYFRERAANPQLNPRNLNNAPVVMFGQVLTPEDLAQADIGGVENNINRTPRG